MRDPEWILNKAGNKNTKCSDTKICTVCLSTALKREPFYYLWDGRRWDILRCKRCKHEFVYPLLTHSEQKKIYGDHYFKNGGDWVCGIWDGSYIQNESNLRREAEEVLKMIPLSCGELLEVGCAGGFFLDEARKKGYGVIGIEPNSSMAEFGKAKLSIEVIASPIEMVEENKFSTQFDAIVLMDVLEHIPHPYKAMRKLSAWLKEGGFLLIRGPLSNDPTVKIKQFLRRLIGKQKRLPRYPLDVNWFSKRSLEYLVNQFGINVVSYLDESRGFANVLAQKKAKKVISPPFA